MNYKLIKVFLFSFSLLFLTGCWMDTDYVIIEDTNFSGNITVNNSVLFPLGSYITENSTGCLILAEFTNTERIELCANNTIFFYSNDTLAYTTNSQNTTFSTVVGGNGSNLFDVPFDPSGLNLTNLSFWTENSTEIYNNNPGTDVRVVGNLNVNNNLTANNINYPLVDGDQGDIVVTDGQGQLNIQTFLLDQVADYCYAENDTEGSVSGAGITVTPLTKEINATGGFYRAQAYLELKTSTNNKRVIVFIGTDGLNNESLTTVNTPLGDAYQFVSPFASNINLTAGLHNVTVSLFNVDNTLLTWRRVRLEIMKVSEQDLIN